MKLNAFVYLLGYGFVRCTVRRIKCIVIAISATASSFGSVPVWTGKSGINGNFLHPLTKSPLKVVAVSVKPSVMSPGKYFVRFYHSLFFYGFFR
jgi:hypothetical protein